MTGFASTGMSGWNNARISAQFFRAVKACDLIDFTADHGGQSRADPRHAEQVLMHRFSPTICLDRLLNKAFYDG